MIPGFALYLFDIDGTLLDSERDICGAVRAVLDRAGAGGVSDAYLRSFIGRHLIDLFSELFPDRAPEHYDSLIQEYRTNYHAREHRMTRPYPGVAEALARLGGRKSTATTKGTPTTRYVLEKFGLLQHFHHVQGTDGFPAKPAPDVILKSLDLFAVRAEDCLMVGDSPADMEAGRHAGVRTCAVKWGYGNHEKMAKWSPDYWIETPDGLLE